MLKKHVLIKDASLISMIRVWSFMPPLTKSLRCVNHYKILLPNYNKVKNLPHQIIHRNVSPYTSQSSQVNSTDPHQREVFSFKRIPPLGGDLWNSPMHDD